MVVGEGVGWVVVAGCHSLGGVRYRIPHFEKTKTKNAQPSTTRWDMNYIGVA